MDALAPLVACWCEAAYHPVVVLALGRTEKYTRCQVPAPPSNGGKNKEPLTVVH